VSSGEPVVSDVHPRERAGAQPCYKTIVAAAPPHLPISPAEVLRTSPPFSGQRGRSPENDCGIGSTIDALGAYRPKSWSASSSGSSSVFSCGLIPPSTPERHRL
jgi:hypothetical protein